MRLRILDPALATLRWEFQVILVLVIGALDAPAKGGGSVENCVRRMSGKGKEDTLWRLLGAFSSLGYGWFSVMSGMLHCGKPFLAQN